MDATVKEAGPTEADLADMVRTLDAFSTREFVLEKHPSGKFSVNYGIGGGAYLPLIQSVSLKEAFHDVYVIVAYCGKEQDPVVPTKASMLREEAKDAPGLLSALYRWLAG